MSDLISRQAAIKEFECCELTPDGGIDANYAIDFLKELPSADRPQGEWIPNTKIGGWGETWNCSLCGEKTTSSIMGEPRYKYCPMCGARMKGDNDEID